MAIDKLQGLKGLQGLGGLSKEQFDNFINKNRDLISKHGYDPTYINNLYSNKQFIDRYGIEKFKAMPDIEMRNAFYKDDIVNTEFNKRYNPKFNKSGFSLNDFNKYNQLSSDAKLKLMESNYLTPSEFENRWQRDSQKHNKDFNSGKIVISSPTGFSMPSLGGLSNSSEAGKRLALDKNNRILQNIYDSDVDSAAKRFTSQVADAYYSSGIAAMSDSQVKQAFIQAIKGNPRKGDLGISDYMSHYGNGTANDITSEMQDFSIDDMRKVLAKREVYYANMSPEMASTALNNDAKRYIREHQGSFKRFGLFMKDVGISAMSYTADKVNGVYNLGLAVADAMGDKPVVMVDDKGNVLDPKRTKLVRSKNRGLYYQDSGGQMHSVHQEQVDRTTLHSMGRNFDGSEDEGILNPLYWTRAEQFGTLDSDEQKQYEKIGSSPYKVAYNPNEDSNLWYEAFKMASFGIADAASQLIPYGIGMAGKALSTASKVGKVTRGLGKALDTTGKLLTAQTKVGQVAQGTAGALGIAYAYGRGAFQETLQQNLANAEEAIQMASRNDVYNMYNRDRKYKAEVDKLINARAVRMKSDYLARMQGERMTKILDEKSLDKMFHAKAQDAVVEELVQKRLKERMDSREYADLQQEAIDGAGDAAFNSFLTEGIKYGFVNNFGYRKYLYTNPAGLTKKVSSSLKGIKEITTSAGRQRLATEASKFLTRGQKLKQFGKTLASQVWGGAWTNGTDDMQVDAAERINEDSFKRYLDAYQNGEALADTYGFADGLYSYMKGLGNSLGQETTWNSALVGGLGSVVNFTPNFANIARLATKEGREAYRNNFNREAVRDEDGIPLKNEDGSVKYKDLKWTDNWRERVNYLIQNGVFNTYYGKKQGERDLQSHADYVNNILDSYNDFKDIEGLVASNIATENLTSPGDAKTLQYLKAIHAILALNNLANNSSDPATMSSVVQKAKDFISKAAQLKSINDMIVENPFSNEEMKGLLSQYYAANPGVEQSEYNSQKALYTIAQNAQKLMEASEAYDKAGEEILKIGKNRGITIDQEVKTRMMLQQALNNHWEERKQKMQSEIDDMSIDGKTTDASTIIATVGGVDNAKKLIKVYNGQQTEIEKEIEEQKKNTVALAMEHDKAVDALDYAENHNDSRAIVEARKKEKDTREKLQASREQENYLNDLMAATVDKRKSLEESMQSMSTKVLTADEIFALDPVTRARMMNEENRSIYSKEQQREIEKLEKKLLSRDADALQKIQDISLLTQRIDQNKDAYSRMAKNPEAAAKEFERQRNLTALTAYNLINRKNADIVVDSIHKLEDELNEKTDINNDFKNYSIYRILRKFNSDILDIIDKEGLLPQYQQQIREAKEWKKTTEDIDVVVSLAEDKDEAWKDNIRKNLDNITSRVNTKEELLKQLEKVVDDTDDSTVADDFDYILNGLTKLGYQRDATIVEERKKRKQREEEDRKKKKEEKQKQEAVAKEAAEKKVAEDKEKQDTDNSNMEQVPDKNAEMNEEIGNAIIFNEDGTTEELSNEKESSTEKHDTKQDTTAVNTQGIENILDDKTGDTSLTAGDMWYGTADNAKKGKFTVTRMGNSVTFDTDNKTDTLRISSDNYEITSKTKEHKENAVFEASSIEKRDDGWYFIGNFAGTKDTTEVKAKKDFNISKAIEKQQAVRETELAVKNTDIDSVNIIDNGDSVQGKSASIDEQMGDNALDDKDIHVSDTNTDANELNTIEQSNADINTTTLSGNAMSRYEPTPLEEDGKIVLKKGKDSRTQMDDYYAWMDAAGIKLQNIIDHELARIIEKNPHAKVKFLMVNPNDNATHDKDMGGHLMLVLDYDDKVNKGITAIHNDANGGVIETNDKKYLVIGVAGFSGGNEAQRLLYFRIKNKNTSEYTASPTRDIGLIIPNRAKFLKANSKERFYVDEQYTTEIVPYSLIPGYIVRQTVEDSSTEYRSVKELLADKERNPLGYDFNTVAWGIQELTQFLTVGTSVDKVMIPRNTVRNSGSAFVLMPASNGKLVPSYLKVLKYTEMKDGKLKDRIDSLLQEIASPVYKTRYDAIIALSNIFYFNKDGDTILTRKNREEVSFVYNGKVQKTFVLDSNFDRAKFIKAFEEMNPRVNITAKVLSSQDLLDEYDEAGALMTDAAMFGTVGSSYRIYGLGAEGNMLKPTESNNSIPKAAYNSDFRNEHRKQVIYKKQHYTKTDGVFYLNGKAITDDKLIQQLEYNERIEDSMSSPVKSEGVWNYYVLSTGNNPEVIKQDRNSKEVKVVPKEEAKKILDKIKEEKEMAQREKMAQEALEEGTGKILGDVDLGNGNLILDPETGEMIQADLNDTSEIQEEEKTPNESQKKNVEKNIPQSDKKSTVNVSPNTNTQTFIELFRNRVYKRKLQGLIKNKWNDAPSNPAELEKFLKGKNVEIDSIGTSKEDIEAWIKTLENCR